MIDIARTLLTKLLKQADRGGRTTVPVNETSAKDYFLISDLSHRDSVHANLLNAEAAGAVSLEWGKGSASQDLVRIRLRDADKLAEWLGLQRAKSYSDRITEQLSEISRNFPDWLCSAYDAALVEWKKGNSTLRVRADEFEMAIKLFRIAYAVSQNEHIGLDLRRFSVRLLNDSKAVENLLLKLAPLLRCNPEWAQLDDNSDLFRYLGLEKFTPPILIKGPLCIQYSGEYWDFSKLRPYVGVSSDMVSEISAIGDVPYLLTIENLASFQRHVREIDDDAVVIYTAGFPSPSLSKILRLLDDILESKCDFYHWGDRDIGGLRIFSHVENLLHNHILYPHLMSEEYIGSKKFEKKHISALEQYAMSDSKASDLARLWLDNSLHPMEQEYLDPIAPSLNDLT